MVDQYKRKTGTIQKVCLIRPQINEDMQELPDFSPKMLLMLSVTTVWNCFFWSSACICLLLNMPIHTRTTCQLCAISLASSSTTPLIRTLQFSQQQNVKYGLTLISHYHLVLTRRTREAAQQQFKHIEQAIYGDRRVDVVTEAASLTARYCVCYLLKFSVLLYLLSFNVTLGSLLALR